MISSDSPVASDTPGVSSPRVFHLLILLVPFACAWWFVAAALFGQWIDDPNYTHGLFVVPMAALLAWRRRGHLSATAPEPTSSGLILLAVAAVLYLLGILAAELFTMRLSMVLAIIALVATTQGWKRTRVLAFPLLFLLLMIPLPYVIYYKLTFPLQLESSKLTAHLLSALGMPVVRSGNVINLEDYSLEVVSACSGLRSMMTLGTLAVFMTDFFRFGRVGNVALVLLAVPIAVVANTARLALTAVMSAVVGAGAADSFLHESSGVVVFLAGLLLLTVSGVLLEWISKRTHSQSGS
jgi:exosortase